MNLTITTEELSEILKYVALKGYDGKNIIPIFVPIGEFTLDAMYKAIDAGLDDQASLERYRKQRLEKLAVPTQDPEDVIPMNKDQVKDFRVYLTMNGMEADLFDKTLKEISFKDAKSIVDENVARNKKDIARIYDSGLLD